MPGVRVGEWGGCIVLSYMTAIVFPAIKIVLARKLMCARASKYWAYRRGKFDGWHVKVYGGVMFVNYKLRRSNGILIDVFLFRYWIFILFLEKQILAGLIGTLKKWNQLFHVIKRFCKFIFYIYCLRNIVNINSVKDLGTTSN